MDEPVKKRVDESWKEQAAREKQQAATPGPGQPPATEPGTPPGDLSGRGRRGSPEAAGRGAPAPGGAEEPAEARFDLFLSGLAMETLIALGEMPHPATRKQAANLPHAKYLIDLLGILEDKTRGNLLAEETQLLKDALYQLRMRYLAKSGG